MQILFDPFKKVLNTPAFLVDEGDLIAEKREVVGQIFIGLAGIGKIPVVNDRVKLLAYRIFDPVKKVLLPTKKALDLTPQIAKRAYEIYEQQGRRDGQAGQDWLEAEREIRKDESHK